MTLHYFYEKMPEPGTTFKATFADESGFNIFRRGEDGCFYWADENKEFISYPEWFEEAGYLYWEYLDEDNT